MALIPANIRLIIEGGLAAVTALSVLGILLFSEPLRRSRETEDKLLRRLMLAVLFFAAADLLREYQLSFGLVPPESVIGNMIYFLPDLIELVYVLFWLIFVDYTVCRSPESIQRRYRFALVPFCVLIAAQIVYFILMKRVFDEYNLLGETTPQSMLLYDVWGWIYFLLDLIIAASYMFYAWHIIRVHQRESRLPLFLRLDVFIIPFVIGIITKNIPGLTLFLDVPCAMLSVLLTYLAVRRRYKYLDFETGFYNQAFLEFIGSYAKEHGYENGSVIEIDAPGHEKEFSKLFSGFKPEESLMVRMKEGVFLLISSVNSENTIKLFCDMLTEGINSQDPEIRLSFRHWIRGKGEDINSFSGRVMSEIN